jgi:RNA dependent RNA polymerase
LNEASSTTNGLKQIEFSGDAAAIGRIKASEIKLRTLPSKLGARLAQAYTTTDPSIELSRDEIEIISDITVENPTESTVASEFTDGYGCISLQLAGEIWKALNADSAYLPNPAPSCYQVRSPVPDDYHCVDQSA